MKKNLIAVVGVILLCSQALPSFAEEAAVNYTKMCASCHGKDKKGSPAMVKMFKVEPAAMDLTAIPADADIAAIISGGKGKMTAYKAKLTAEEIAGLASYLKPAETRVAEAKPADAVAVDTNAAAPVVVDTNAVVAVAADTAAAGFKAADTTAAVQAAPAAKAADNADFKAKCASCHAKDAKGNPAMAKMFKVEPSALDLTAKAVQEKPDEDLAAIITGGKGKMPAFKGKLEDSQISEIVKYLKTFFQQEKP